MKELEYIFIKQIEEIEICKSSIVERPCSSRITCRQTFSHMEALRSGLGLRGKFIASVNVTKWHRFRYNDQIMPITHRRKLK